MFKDVYWNYYTAFKIRDMDALNGVSINNIVISCVCKGNELVSQKVMPTDQEEYIAQEQADMKEKIKGLSRLYSERCAEELYHLSLLPMKMCIDQQSPQICPVHVDVFKNGYAVLVVTVHLCDVKQDAFRHYPIKRWYQHLEMPRCVVEGGNGIEYAPLSHPDEGIEDLIFLIQKYIKTLFGDKLQDEQEYAACENFVVSGMENPDIHQIKGTQTKALHQLYQLLNPEEFGNHLSDSDLREFWCKTNVNVSGIHVLVGNNFRTMMYADVEELLQRYGRNVTELDTGVYLQRSVELSFESLIEIALVSKLNGRYVYLAAEREVHLVNRYLTLYFQNQNYFEDLVDRTPITARKFYKVYTSSMEYERSLFRVQERIERLEYIERYAREKLQRRLSILVEGISIIGTLIFGLPAITETLWAIRNLWLQDVDLFRISAEQAAFAIWIGLIASLGVMLGRNWMAYKRCDV